MNFINNRDWELYNFDSVMKSSEYDNILINKNIENYFNDIISKPIVTSSNISTISKTGYNFHKFYDEYIEHNLLFIILIIGIIIFLIIRYYSKDQDNFESEQQYNDKFKFDQIKPKPEQINKNLTKNIKKINSEKTKLIKYKKHLDQEKQKILSIIDELSNLNNYEYSKSKYDYPEYLNSNKFNYEDNQLDIADNFEYYDINKNFNDTTNEIDGLYIEPPFA